MLKDFKKKKPKIEENKEDSIIDDKVISEENISSGDNEVKDLLKQELESNDYDNSEILNLDNKEYLNENIKEEKKDKVDEFKEDIKEERKKESKEEIKQEEPKETKDEPKQEDQKEVKDEPKEEPKEEKIEEKQDKKEKKKKDKSKEDKEDKKESVEELDPAKEAFASEDEAKPTDIPDKPKKQTIEDLAADVTGPAKKYAVARAEAKIEKRKKIIIASVTIAACVLSVLGAMLFSILNTSFEDEDPGIQDELSQTSFNEPFYMLLVGTDTREGKSYKLSDGRSDSCILVRVDPVNYIVTMISIPRDTKITVDGSTQKFNAAYAYGGIKETIKQVKKLMGVDISHYAEISFNGLTDMVDAVGGVEVDVPSAINDPNTQVYVPAGHQTLNGEQALSFARSRKFGDGDFTRSADQRVLIEALIHKAYGMDVGEIPNVLKAAKNFVKTDLRLGDMVSLATQFMTSGKELTLYSAMVPSTTGTEGGISYVITDKEALARMMKMVENGEDPLMVEITSGAAVCSSRDAKDLEQRRKEYYAQHPDSPGKISNSSY